MAYKPNPIFSDALVQYYGVRVTLRALTDQERAELKDWWNSPEAVAFGKECTDDLLLERYKRLARLPSDEEMTLLQENSALIAELRAKLAVLKTRHLAMAESERKDERIKCDWEKDRGKPQAAPCGSEDGLFKVTRRNSIGGVREHNICQKHLADAWGRFKVEEAIKRPVPSRTTG